MNNETFYFTVRKLIAVLETLPPDLPVVTSDYESGFENFFQPHVTKLRHEPENDYYDGEFQAAEKNDKDTFDAVVLQRVLRDD